MESKLKISVIIPLYNHERYIRESILSVLGQTVQDFELTIINDGSRDNSGEVVKNIIDPRITYILQDNEGAHAAINRGIRMARGEYISILNSDDIYHRDRFQECLNILESDKSISAVFSHVELIDDNGKSQGIIRGAEENWKGKDRKTSFKGEGNPLLDLLAGNFLTTTSNLFCRKSVFDAIGYFRNLRYAHDYDFFLRMCCNFNVAIIERPLLCYRIHDVNTIRENESAVAFEVGLVLAHLFLRHDMTGFFEEENKPYTAMLKVFNSLNAYKMEKMILTLLLFSRDSSDKEDFFTTLTEDAHNPFRMTCIDNARQGIEQWQYSQRAWKTWQETNKRLEEALSTVAGMKEKLRESERKISELNEKLKAAQVSEMKLEGGSHGGGGS